MLSLKDNIRAVLECHFSQSKDELIDSATDNIYHLVTVNCPIIKERTPKHYCAACFFFGKEFCKQYQIEVSETDGCSNYEIKGE